MFEVGAPSLNVVVEGNSISADFYTSIGSFDNHLMTVEPLASSGATHASKAVSGSRWSSIISRGSQIDALWSPGRNNVLILNEHINSLFGGVSVATIQQQVTDYLDARLALNAWRVIYWRTLPYGGSGAYAAMNDNMVILDDWMEGNAAGLGIERVVDPRVIPAFDHDGKTAAPFEAYPEYWHETAVRYVHPLDVGKLQIAALIVAAMETMPATLTP